MTGMEQVLVAKMRTSVETKLQEAVAGRQPMCALRSHLRELVTGQGFHLWRVEVVNGQTIVVAVQEHPDDLISYHAPDWCARERGTETPPAR